MNQKLDSLAPTIESRVTDALQEILDAPEWDRRASQRFPYFGPVAIARPNTKSVSLSAFARDISASGIGLVHLMPLEKGEFVVTLSLPSGQPVSILTQICWCRDYGNGWYSSGGQFVDVIS